MSLLSLEITSLLMPGSRWGTGGSGPHPHLKNHKNIGFLCNTGWDHLKNHKAAKPAFESVFNGTPAQRHLNDGQLLVCFCLSLSPSSKKNLYMRMILVSICLQIFTSSQITKLFDLCSTADTCGKVLTLSVICHIAENIQDQMIEFLPQLCDESLFNPDTMGDYEYMRIKVIYLTGLAEQVCN